MQASLNACMCSSTLHDSPWVYLGKNLSGCLSISCMPLGIVPSGKGLFAKNTMGGDEFGCANCGINKNSGGVSGGVNSGRIKTLRTLVLIGVRSSNNGSRLVSNLKTLSNLSSEKDPIHSNLFFWALLAPVLLMVKINTTTLK